MKTNKTMLCVLGSMLLFTVAAASAADAPKLTFKFTTVQIEGAHGTGIYYVNNAGALVGQYVDSAGVTHGFKLLGHTLTTLDDPKWSGRFSECEAINSHNVIVGDYINSSGISTSFIYQRGKFHDIGPANSYAYGINDSEIVTGFYQDPAGVYHGYVWHQNTWTRLDKPGASYTLAAGINNNGLITVQWGDKAGNVESSVYDPQTKKYIGTINVPGAVNTWAHAIDSAGDVVFTWQGSPTGPYQGALCTQCTSTSRKYYKFDDPKGTSTFGNGINDHKLVVGNYNAAESEGFKATY
jgi:hypothetical protein